MKILIVSTPKTGNTWVKNLLGSAYDLPIRDDVIESFSESVFDAFGPRWIVTQHYYPESNLLKWVKKNDVVLVTTIRHPADVFVSLYHYSSNFGEEKPLREALDKDNGKIGPNVLAYVESGYFLLLAQSISWMHTGLSHVVRYEDLWRNQIPGLTELTKKIREIPAAAVSRAVEKCSLDSMRKKATDEERKFFRKGGSGGWRESLPPEVIRMLTEMAPYPAQFAALGYQMHAPAA